MPTSWTDYPATSTTPAKALHINEVRAAINTALGFTPNWTDGATVSNTTPIRARHFTEIRDTIQTLWRDRGLGLIPRWTSGAEPGGPSLSTTATPIRASDINDVRRWFNHYETWGDLRGVHWFKSGMNDFPHVGWNVETVIGVSTEIDGYNEPAVQEARSYCINARNYGLVNIVRLEWKSLRAVPTNSAQYTSWRTNFNLAVENLRDVAEIFVVGNEPTVEPGMTASQYAAAFNNLFPTKVANTLYLATGPAVWSFFGSELDTVWLQNASDAITNLDGWALHAYGSPYLQYAESGGTPCSALCSTATTVCPISCNPDPGGLTGDASFRRFRDYIDLIRAKWAAKPVYLTEMNTKGYSADTQPNGGVPSSSYITGWMQTAYQEIYNFNSETNPTRSQYPRVLALAWFVDDPRSTPEWEDYALSNTDPLKPKLQQARTDFKNSVTSTGIMT